MENQSYTENSSHPMELYINTPKEHFPNLMGESPFDLHQWEGYWYRLPHLPAAIAAKKNFQAQEDDILLASSMKTGTTWLKALIPTIINLDKNKNKDEDDPLVKNHPNALMPSLEVQLFLNNPNPDLSHMSSSPRLFRTHIPYPMLSDSIKNSSGGCKIVYITRDPKDTFVSLWHFVNSMKTSQQKPFPMSELFEKFCRGVHPFGPFHHHVLGYWKESQKRPEKVLFLKYEEMKRDPRGEVKKLGAFLGKNLGEEDVDKVLSRCSLGRLKSLEVNKNGVDGFTRIKYSAYFRTGIVGDWKNSLSEEMKERLDEITRLKMEGSGLHLGI